MKTRNFNTLLKLAAAIGFLGLPAGALATVPATPGSSPAAGLAAAYEETGAAPEKTPLLPGLALEGSGSLEENWVLKVPFKTSPPADADLQVNSEEAAPRVKRVSRLQEPGEAMGGGKERKEAAAKKAASEDKE